MVGFDGGHLSDYWVKIGGGHFSGCWVKTSGGLFLWWVVLVVAMCGAMVVGLMVVVARLGFWLYGWWLLGGERERERNKE